MRIRLLVAALVVALLGILSVPSARGQEALLVSSASLEVATDVVNGRVLVVQSMDTGSEVHSLALVAIDETFNSWRKGLCTQSWEVFPDALQITCHPLLFVHCCIFFRYLDSGW